MSFESRTVPCPLGASCSDSGRHFPGSRTLEEHARQARGEANFQGERGGGIAPVLASTREELIDETMSSRLSDYDEDQEIYGDEIGYGQFGGLQVEIRPGLDYSGEPGYGIARTYEDSLDEEDVADAVASGHVEVVERDGESQYWLTKKGCDAAAKVLADEFVQNGGDPHMVDRISVETDSSADYANYDVAIRFPREAADMSVSEAVEGYFDPLYKAMETYTGSGSVGSKNLYKEMARGV